MLIITDRIGKPACKVQGDLRMAARVIEEFGDVFDVIVNKKRMGQLFSIDKAYSVVDTEYIFHCEDDWVPHLATAAAATAAAAAAAAAACRRRASCCVWHPAVSPCCACV
jgi:hypothetical protein